MLALQAQTAREIDKHKVFDGVNVALHDAEGKLISQSAEEQMRAGDFYFRTSTSSHYEKSFWFRREILRKPEKLIIEQHTMVVMSCPFCGLPLMTPPQNAILSHNPLTLERPVQCPYGYNDTAHAFKVQDGTISRA